MQASHHIQFPHVFAGRPLFTLQSLRGIHIRVWDWYFPSHKSYEGLSVYTETTKGLHRHLQDYGAPILARDLREMSNVETNIEHTEEREEHGEVLAFCIPRRSSTNLFKWPL